MALKADARAVRGLGNTTTNAGLHVNGLKVVGAREANILNTTAAANSNNVGIAATGISNTINTVLVAMRAHGLIANTNTISTTAVAKVQRGATGLFVNDLQVVGAQQEAIADTEVEVNNTTNIADIPTKLNLVIVALKTHGLIASS